MVAIAFAKLFAYSAMMFLSVIPLSVVIAVEATSAQVLLDPSTQTVGAVGDSFTANVSVTDVSSLYSYEFKLYYKSAVINGTQAVAGSFLKSSGRTLFRVINFTDHYDSTYGVVWIVCSLLENVSGASGSGVLARIEFSSVSVGYSVPLHLADVELFDSDGFPIPHGVLDGTVTVIPEFTSALLFLTLTFVSVFGVLVEKRARHQDLF